MNCPCKECDRRQVGCHSDCDEYKTWDAWNKEKNKQRSDEKQRRDCRSKAYEKAVRKSLRRK